MAPHGTLTYSTLLGDQIVLSAARYATVAPGVAKNDATIIPRTPQ